MHNPNRHNPNRSLHQRRQPPPGAGISHASIMRKHSGPSSVPAGDRTPTKTGFSISLFEGESFATRFEVIGPRCTTGQLRNKTDDRTIFVVAGTIFVTTFVENEEPVTVKMHEGTFFSAPRGTVYEIATSTGAVELYFSEALLYSMHLEELTPAIVGESRPDEDFVENRVASPTPVTRQQNPKAVQYQIEQANASVQRRERQKAAGIGVNAHSANVNAIGVNPAPSGPPRED